MNTAACSSCGRAIIWVTSPNGKSMPLTARPVTVYAIDEGSPDDRHTPDAVKVEMGSKVYISHFVDCPNAAEHSRR